MFRNPRRNYNSGPRPQRRSGFGGLKSHIDVSKFIKKAVLSENQTSYTAKNNFNDFNILEQIKTNIKEKGYAVPTPIQDQVIPLVLEGKDVVGIANTGTGKTAAFLIPLINKVYNNRFERVLIITPTRELALQIQEEFRIFARNLGIYSVLVIGGANMHNQIMGLMKNPNFIIGTPGRIKDMVLNNKINLSIFNNIVLDEVDRMLDMGFIGDIKFFISRLPVKRQSLFFSATIPTRMYPLMHSFLTNPVQISVKVQETAEAVEQDVVRTYGKPKVDVLSELLTQKDFDKVLIFGRTKWGVEKLSNALSDKGFKAMAIHGNKSQGQRQRALDQFKRGEVNILLATDVASRGLDIEDVSHVINYDQPATYEDYIHRIGRTGRANKKGMALTFID